MVKDAQSTDFTIGVIGTGAMGRGIAQIMAVGGMKVLMFDAGWRMQLEMPIQLL